MSDKTSDTIPYNEGNVEMGQEIEKASSPNTTSTNNHPETVAENISIDINISQPKYNWPLKSQEAPVYNWPLKDQNNKNQNDENQNIFMDFEKYLQTS